VNCECTQVSGQKFKKLEGKNTVIPQEKVPRGKKYYRITATRLAVKSRSIFDL
jgi:hypothetical protein